jgi:hypothetical protein
MLEDLILLVFCFLVAVAGLAVVTFEVISGRFPSMDSLWLNLISLTLAAVFGGNLAWSFHTGEAQQMLRHFRKGPAARDATEKNSTANK